MYSIITPYLVPNNLNKVKNIGDAFIYDACEKLIKTKAAFYFSQWEELTEDKIEKINSTKFLIIAGANILKDNMKICKNFSEKTLVLIKVPIILAGIGHYGIKKAVTKLSNESQSLLFKLLERFEFISVRCNESKRFIIDSNQSFQKKIIMTGCPGSFSVDGINNKFNQSLNENCKLVSTITERGYLNLQLKGLGLIKKIYPNKYLTVSIHQNYNSTELLDFFKKNEIKVFVSNNYNDYIRFYSECDLHIGNRIHAHLKFLSMGIKSYLLPFDLRQVFFSECYKFPLITKIPCNEIDNYDFEIYTKHIKTISKNMDFFIKKIHNIL